MYLRNKINVLKKKHRVKVGMWASYKQLHFFRCLLSQSLSAQQALNKSKMFFKTEGTDQWTELTFSIVFRCQGKLFIAGRPEVSRVPRW